MSRITIDPAICNGKPVIREMRITVQTVLEYLSAGESYEEILKQFPMLEPEDVSACLAFAGKFMGHTIASNKSPASRHNSRTDHRFERCGFPETKK